MLGAVAQTMLPIRPSAVPAVMNQRLPKRSVTPENNQEAEIILYRVVLTANYYQADARSQSVRERNPGQIRIWANICIDYFFFSGMRMLKMKVLLTDSKDRGGKSKATNTTSQR